MGRPTRCSCDHDVGYALCRRGSEPGESPVTRWRAWQARQLGHGPQPSVARVVAGDSAAQPQRGKERRPRAQSGRGRSQSLEEIGGIDQAVEGRTRGPRRPRVTAAG
ncbi:hypothetical protein NDU88_001964 [Pleurodeles waltl]|uniref:Uncharacterized protein n=1 Tax=Pleurodeles waltl TaxID=8319 RepID=A0AAV7T0Z6_PLEWA|nr:hypothetical protein NDU88_001964 [Pleurodeles waltl]